MKHGKDITRREWLAGAAAAAGYSFFKAPSSAAEVFDSSETSVPPSPSEKPSLNVVYIVADDLGWADVGYHGLSPIRTPNIDKLVREGVELDRFYGCPVCSPSRACVMTGRSPMRYGMIYAVVRPWETHGIPQNERLLPEVFRDAGYQTWMVGKWHLGQWNARLTPNARGFNHFYGFLTGEIDYFKHTREKSIDWQRNGTTVAESGYTTNLFAAEAVRLIEGRDRTKPFFLYLPFNAPHQPLMAPEELILSYGQIEDLKRRTYAAMVTSMDMAIGQIRDALERSSAADNTLIVFHSDNGGQTHQGAVNLPLRAGKSTAFEGGIRVPALLHAPHLLPAGVRSKQVLTNLDIFPTLAAAAQIEPHNTLPFDGRDMWSTVTKNSTLPREDLFFAIGERGVWQHAVFHGQWKLVLEKKQVSSREDQQDEPERGFLFQIEEDPFERTNLADAYPEVVKDLTERIRQWSALYPLGDIAISSAPHPGFVAPEEWAHCSIP